MFRASNFHRTAAAHPTSSHLDLILENQTPTHIYVYSLCLNPKCFHSNTAVRSPDREARQTRKNEMHLENIPATYLTTSDDITCVGLQYRHWMLGPQSEKGFS